jgi:hypothetical protein
VRSRCLFKHRFATGSAFKTYTGDLYWSTQLPSGTPNVPYIQKNIDKVEMVQQRAARWALNRYHNTSSVTDMLQSLSWPILQQRRSEARLCLMYKMVHGLVATNIGLYAVPVSRQTRRTHPHSFIQLQPRLEAYRMSFFLKTIVEWNQLPSGSVPGDQSRPPP